MNLNRNGVLGFLGMDEAKVNYRGFGTHSNLLRIFLIAWGVTSLWASLDANPQSDVTSLEGDNLTFAQQDFHSNDICETRNNSINDNVFCKNEFLVNVVRDNFIVKYDGYYDEKDRLQYLQEALRSFSIKNYQWGVLPHSGLANKYPSDFDVLQVDPNATHQVIEDQEILGFVVNLMRYFMRILV